MSVTDQLTMPDCHAAWHCTPTGFALVSPLAATRSVAAVGSVDMARAGRRILDARSEIAELLLDVALTEGHEAAALFDRANDALRQAGLGRVDALALLSRAGDASTPTVSGVGSPLPLVVTKEHMSAPALTWVGLAPGWAVVLGSLDGMSTPAADLLSPSDVRAALSLFDPSMLASSPRTLLAVVLDPIKGDPRPN